MIPKTKPAVRAGHAICGLGLGGFLLGAMLCFVGLAALHPGLAVPANAAAGPAKTILWIGFGLLLGGWLAFFATVRHLPARRATANR